MQRVIINMRNHVLGEAVELALRSSGDFQVTVVDNPAEAAHKCYSLAATALLLEAAGFSPYTLEERLKLREAVRLRSPNCKIVIMVDENSDPQLAEQVKQAKRDGLIDQFIYGSTSASYLVAVMDTL